MANINPDELIIQLIENVSTHKKHSLETLHNICREQYKRGSKDFSVATIARISAEHDGPSEQTIRNTAGLDYRALLKAWADYSEGYSTKQKTNQQSTTADTILAGISDPTIRALVGVILAENKKLKNENVLLKHQTTLTIDMRAHQNNSALQTSSVELIPQSEGLLPTELSALEHAISDDLFSHQGWTADAQGRVKNKGMQLYKAGYVTAIKKILNYT
jgi:repressor of nif and glnA expression